MNTCSFWKRRKNVRERKKVNVIKRLREKAVVI